jgi:hypothetical protein
MFHARHLPVLVRQGWKRTTHEAREHTYPQRYERSHPCLECVQREMHLIQPIPLHDSKQSGFPLAPRLSPNRTPPNRSRGTDYGAAVRFCYLQVRHKRTAGILASRSPLRFEWQPLPLVSAGSLCRGFGGLVVVLFVVDLFAIFVLLFVDLLFLLGIEGAAVGGAVVVNLLRGFGLVPICFGGFARGHLTAAEAVGGALLLISLAVVYGVGRYRVGVVFLVVDLTAGSVLFAVDLLALLAGELATIGGAIVVDLLVDVRLGALGAGRFT